MRVALAASSLLPEKANVTVWSGYTECVQMLLSIPEVMINLVQGLGFRIGSNIGNSQLTDGNEFYGLPYAYGPEAALVSL